MSPRSVRGPSRRAFAALTAVLVAGCLNVARPDLLDVVPDEAQEGDEIAIFGENFVDDFSQTRVFFAGLVASPSNLVSITSTEIHVRVPPGAVSGDVVVSVGGVESGRAALKVLGPWLVAGTAATDGVTVFDSHTGLVQVVLPAAAAPNAMDFALDGSFAWLVGDDAQGGFATRFDSSEQTLRDRVAIAGAPVSLDFDLLVPAVEGFPADRAEAWVGHASTGTVEIIESSTPKVRASVDTGAPVSTILITPEGKTGLALQPSVPALALLDAEAAQPTVLASLALGPDPGPLLVHDLVVKAFVLERADAKIAFVDPTTKEITSRLPIGPDPVDMVRSGNTLYVASRTNRTIELVDTTGETLISTIPITGDPSRLAVLFTTSESLIWVLTDGTVLRGYDQIDKLEKKTIDVDPNVIAFRPLVVATGNSLYLAHDLTPGQVTQVEQPDTRVRRTVLNGQPRFFAIQP